MRLRSALRLGHSLTASGMAVIWMAARCSESWIEDRQCDGEQNQGNHDRRDQLACGMAKVYGPAKAVALGNEGIRIIGVVVEEAVPVPIIIAVCWVGELAVGRGARLRPGSPCWQEEDEQADDQQ